VNQHLQSVSNPITYAAATARAPTVPR
jgi:hypothetical protein